MKTTFRGVPMIHKFVRQDNVTIPQEERPARWVLLSDGSGDNIKVSGSDDKVVLIEVASDGSHEGGLCQTSICMDLESAAEVALEILKIVLSTKRDP